MTPLDLVGGLHASPLFVPVKHRSPILRTSRQHGMRRRARERRATPPWADKAKIERFTRNPSMTALATTHDVGPVMKVSVAEIDDQLNRSIFYASNLLVNRMDVSTVSTDSDAHPIPVCNDCANVHAREIDTEQRRGNVSRKCVERNLTDLRNVLIDSLIERPAVRGQKIRTPNRSAGFIQRNEEMIDHEASNPDDVHDLLLLGLFFASIGFDLLCNLEVSLDENNAEGASNCKRGRNRLSQRKIVTVVPRHA